MKQGMRRMLKFLSHTEESLSHTLKSTATYCKWENIQEGQTVVKSQHMTAPDDKQEQSHILELICSVNMLHSAK